MTAHVEDLTWDRDQFPLAERNVYRTSGSEGWQVLRTDGDIAYGFSGPSTQGDIVVTFTLPESMELLGVADRGWQQGAYLGIWDLTKPDVYRDALPVDVPLVSVLCGLPDGLVDLAVTLHDRYVSAAERKFQQLLEMASSAADSYFADGDRAAEQIGLGIGLAGAEQALAVLRRLGGERTAVDELLRLRSRRR